MATISMDLQDFNSLMALGTARRRAVFLDLYNSGRTKAGVSTASGPDSVVVAPTNVGTGDPANTVVTRVKAAITAAA
ncbi:hypothetical protein C4J65_10475 [Streptomyces sp. CB09001]|uniref:hypothetical protein n=1 Tax=Streptomyces sp. CB09001 TaxID=2083284 RepID=UPI000E21712E|nr:hypothetical protein [Streptomyces sp. CB09001]AXL88704.1 hypothetical protein C4J65_10475 [Streptomyces sp. CB09001]